MKKKANIRLIQDDGGWFARYDEINKYGLLGHSSIDEFIGESDMSRETAMRLACEYLVVKIDDIKVIDRTELAYMK